MFLKLHSPDHYRLTPLRTYLSIFFYLIAAGPLRAQDPGTDFLREFKKADAHGKVKLTASKRFAEIRAVYPLIKDTLDAIRKNIFITPQPNQMKIFFDEIDAELALENKDYGKAIFILRNGLQAHAADINDSLKCWIELKKLFVRIKHYNRALEVHSLIESKWHRRTDTAHITMGVAKSSIYQRIGLVTLAITERRREFHTDPYQHDTLKTASYYNDLGVFYNALKNSDSAEYYLKKAKRILARGHFPAAREQSVVFFNGLIDGNLALALFNRGDYTHALTLVKNDILYSLKSRQYESALNSYLLAVDICVALKKLQLAKLYFDSATVIHNTHIKELTPQLRYLITAAAYHSARSNYAGACQAYKSYLELNSKAAEMENEQMLENENVFLDVTRRESENAVLESARQKQQLQEARERSSTAWLLTGILVLSAVIVVLISNNRSTRKREEQLELKNAQISSQKQQIEQSLKEKEMLIREIHHRVKNNLQIITSMLSLQIGKVEDEKTGNILRDAKQRISSIALTHQMLYQKENLANVSLSEYIERLVRQIGFTMPAANIELITGIAIKDSRLSIDTAVPLGLLLNELLTNAYKHAFPENVNGRITVSLRENDTCYILTVSDNGVGLPADFDSAGRKTLGLELVYILADQLDAKVSIETSSGSSFTIELSKQHHYTA